MIGPKALSVISKYAQATMTRFYKKPPQDTTQPFALHRTALPCPKLPSRWGPGFVKKEDMFPQQVITNGTTNLCWVYFLWQNCCFGCCCPWVLFFYHGYTLPLSRQVTYWSRTSLLDFLPSDSKKPKPYFFCLCLKYFLFCVNLLYLAPIRFRNPHIGSKRSATAAAYQQSKTRKSIGF